MLKVEDGAGEILDAAVGKYENHFEQSFPLYEHLDKTSNEEYDISITGAEKLAAFIDGRLKSGQAVPVPTDYEDRMY